MTRDGDFDVVMKALWEVCETAKKPSGYLMVKISELERGVFTGATKTDNDLTVFVQKHKLDDRCLAKMIEIFSDRQDQKRNDLKEIERRMKASDKPWQTTVMALLVELKRHGRLPSPEREKKKSKKK